MPAPRLDCAPLLSGWPPFAQLPPAEQLELRRTAHARLLRRGQFLWQAGDRAGHFMLIHHGLIKIVRPRADGQDAIVGIFGPGESIGDSAVVQQAPYPAAAVVSSRGAAVLQIPAPALLRAMRQSPPVSLAVQQVLLAHTRTLREKIEILSAGSVAQRLARLLLYLAERFGEAPDAAAWRMPLAISRAEMAALAGTTVETTIRMLSRWRRQGLIARAPAGGILLPRPERLRQMQPES